MQHGARPLRSTRRLSNLGGQRPGWYKITNVRRESDQMEVTQVSIYDEIGFYGVSAGEFLAELKAIAGDIQLNINSPGGDVWDGIAIYNTLRQAKGNVHVVVDGLAASAASFIAQAASPGQLEVAPHAQMMIHDGFGMVIGNAADLRETANLLDSTSDEIAGIYADRTGKPVDYWRGQMRAETWYTDKQAVAAGLADRVQGQPDTAPQASWDLSVFAKFSGGSTPVADPPPAPVDTAPPVAVDAPPPRIRNAADPAKAKPLGSDGWVQDPDGTVRFDPDGDGDDDSTPEGDTDHDYFGPDGKEIKPVPPKPKPGNRAPVVLLDASDVDSSPWDASKAWAAGADSDDPAKFYAGICAGRKAGDPSTQDAWALPYKYSPSGKANAAGVKNALARLPQTNGLTNEAQARATLERAMKLVNPDYDPGDQIDSGLLSAAFALGLKGA